MKGWNSSMGDENFETNSSKDMLHSGSGSTGSANSTAGPLIASNYSHYQIRVTTVSQSDFEVFKGSKYSSIRHTWVQRLRPKSGDSSQSPPPHDAPSHSGNDNNNNDDDEKSVSGNSNDFTEGGFDNETSSSPRNDLENENRESKGSTNVPFGRNEMPWRSGRPQTSSSDGNAIRHDTRTFPFDRNKTTLKDTDMGTKHSLSSTIHHPSDDRNPTDTSEKPALSNFGFLKSHHPKGGTPVSPWAKRLASASLKPNAAPQSNPLLPRSNASSQTFNPTHIHDKSSGFETAGPLETGMNAHGSRHRPSNALGFNGSSPQLAPTWETTNDPFAHLDPHIRGTAVNSRISSYERVYRPESAMQVPDDFRMDYERRTDLPIHHVSSHPHLQQQQQRMHGYSQHPHHFLPDKPEKNLLGNDTQTGIPNVETPAGCVPSFDFYPKFNETRFADPHSPSLRNSNDGDSSTATLSQSFTRHIAQKESSRKSS